MTDQSTESPTRNRWVWRGKPWQAFKTFAILFSFVMNLVLLLVLLIVGALLLPIVNNVAEPIVGGLNESFIDMSTATISRTIQLDTEMPIAFTLPLSQTTSVVVVAPVQLENVPARFVLPGGGGLINGQVTLALPPGLVLPVHLNLDVPVDQTIPVKMDVPVQIPLSETELGGPFDRLRGLFAPLDRLIKSLPATNEELWRRIAANGRPAGAVDTAVAP